MHLERSNATATAAARFFFVFVQLSLPYLAFNVSVSRLIYGAGVATSGMVASGEQRRGGWGEGGPCA